MIHEFEETGHGPKGKDPGCSCSVPMTEAEHPTHAFMRAYFAAHPEHGRLGSYSYNFTSWGL